ncbi:hypothetical protein [Bradyrhizobium sp.]|uniref:hypothetical protein n=1 Tax=Bradyrhizobium sp. TaxID=376 RepID=UPI00273244D1|nr:hypothetical protein [Bradyrhizobium sp.]MDP3075964.1 hypothetical protein [Bradyrhizobium sp.]
MAALPTMGWRSLRCVMAAAHFSQMRDGTSGTSGLSGEAFATGDAMGAALLEERNNCHGYAPQVGHVR